MCVCVRAGQLYAARYHRVDYCELVWCHHKSILHFVQLRFKYMCVRACGGCVCVFYIYIYVSALCHYCGSVNW